MRSELKIEVALVHGRYGELKVLVDGKTVIEGGKFAFLGVLPSAETIVGAVRDRLATQI